MASINIGGENAGDAFYRYKMPKLKARIEGRGNGIKTNVENNVDIAKALERPPEYILKFFGTELGAQTKFDKGSGTSIVNGAHDASRLSELLESFIKKYVQCYSCGNPETVVKIKKDNISLKCKACGFVSEVDARLKLNTFILKNPPDNKLSKAEKKVKKLEKERMKGLDGENEDKKKKKKSKSKSSKDGDADDADTNGPVSEEPTANGGPEHEEEEDADEVVWMTDTSEAAMARRAAEQLSGATAAMVTQGNLEAEREAAKKKAELEAKKKAEAEAEAARLAEEAARKLELERNPDAAAVAALRADIADGKSPAEVSAALRAASLSGSGPAARLTILYEVLFGEAPGKLSTEVVRQKRYLAPHSRDASGQLAQLVAMEKLLGETLAVRVRETPLVLKTLYDEDLVEEDLILAWYKRSDAASVVGVSPEAGKAVRAAAKPFVEWLEEAESSEEESE